MADGFGLGLIELTALLLNLRMLTWFRRVQGLEFRGFRVYGLGCRVQGFGFGVQGLCFTHFQSENRLNRKTKKRQQNTKYETNRRRRDFSKFVFVVFPQNPKDVNLKDLTLTTMLKKPVLARFRQGSGWTTCICAIALLQAEDDMGRLGGRKLTGLRSA